MGITINELRFLAYQRDVSTVSHYQRFAIPKKSGGERIISAPMPRLKRAQYWLLANILEKVPVTESAQGFVKQRNILTNALPHVGTKVVVNLDLENFFPSVGYPRVKGIFRKIGYSEEVATLCARLTTEAPVSAFELDGTRYFVRTGEAALPQGAPTSPALSNILCRRLDKRLRGAAAKLDADYAAACGGEDEPGVSPIVRYAVGAWRVSSGAIVYLSPSAGPPDRLLARIRCHRAFMMLAPSDMDDCPLDLPDVELDARGDANGITLSLSVRDARLVPELQRRVEHDVEVRAPR